MKNLFKVLLGFFIALIYIPGSIVLSYTVISKCFVMISQSGSTPWRAQYSSLKERSSIECEREVEDMKMAEYMEGHIGEEYEGMISSVMGFGMFIQLDNLIEGLVPIRDMLDFFHYDEEHMTLTGERTHVKYSIGERIVVKVIRASKEEKTIDFEIVRKV